MWLGWCGLAGAFALDVAVKTDRLPVLVTVVLIAAFWAGVPSRVEFIGHHHLLRYRRSTVPRHAGNAHHGLDLH